MSLAEFVTELVRFLLICWLIVFFAGALLVFWKLCEDTSGWLRHWRQG